MRAGMYEQLANNDCEDCRGTGEETTRYAPEETYRCHCTYEDEEQE